MVQVAAIHFHQVMVANNRRVQRPRNDSSGIVGRARSVLSLASGAALVAAPASDDSPSVGFAATPDSPCGAGFVAVAAVTVDPFVAESALPCCVVELVAATCA